MQGVGAGQQVADIAVTVDQRLHRRLLECHSRVEPRWRDGPAAKVEAGKVRPPGRGNAMWLLLPLLVEEIKVRRTDMAFKTHGATFSGWAGRESVQPWFFDRFDSNEVGV